MIAAGVAGATSIAGFFVTGHQVWGWRWPF